MNGQREVRRNKGTADKHGKRNLTTNGYEINDEWTRRNLTKGNEEKRRIFFDRINGINRIRTVKRGQDARDTGKCGGQSPTLQKAAKKNFDAD